MKNKNLFKKTLTNVFVFCVAFLPVLVFAQDIGLKNPIKIDSISGLILIVTRVVRYIAIPFVVLAIMYAGFLYIWASTGFGGKAGDFKKAHDAITYTIIGAFILLSSELIALLMKNTLEGLTK